MAVRNDTENVQVDVTTLSGVRHEREAHSIGPTFWNAIGEVSLLTRLRLFAFLLVEVTADESLVEGGQVDTFNDMERIDDVTERL